METFTNLQYGYSVIASSTEHNIVTLLFTAFRPSSHATWVARCVLVGCRSHIKRLHQVNATIRYPAACSTSSNTSPDGVQHGGKWEMTNCTRDDANATSHYIYWTQHGNRRQTGNIIPIQQFEIFSN